MTGSDPDEPAAVGTGEDRDSAAVGAGEDHDAVETGEDHSPTTTRMDQGDSTANLSEIGEDYVTCCPSCHGLLPFWYQHMGTVTNPCPTWSIASTVLYKHC